MKLKIDNSPAMLAFNALTAKEQNAVMCTYVSRILLSMTTMTPAKAKITCDNLKAKFKPLLDSEPKLNLLIQDALEISKENV